MALEEPPHPTQRAKVHTGNCQNDFILHVQSNLKDSLENSTSRGEPCQLKSVWGKHVNQKCDSFRKDERGQSSCRRGKYIVTMRVDALRLSEISLNVMQSEIRAMSVECDRVGGVNLAQGVCDTPIPDPVIESALRAIRDGNNIYTRADGITPLREAIAAKLERYNGIKVDADGGVLVTSGATGAFYAACQALLDPGDEVVLFEPFYGYHLHTLMALRVKPAIVPTDAPDWEIDFDRVKAAITPRTRAILINSPSNPSGKVFSREELEQLSELAIANDMFVITDEIYEYFLYDGI